MLQTEEVFVNVSKGVLAKRDDLIKAFGTDDTKKCCLAILDKGELQVGEAERRQDLDGRRSDVVAQLAERCHHPGTGRPYTTGVLDRALRNLGWAPDPTRPAKVQARQALTKLKESGLPIDRAPMRLRVVVSAASADGRSNAVELVVREGGTVEHTESGGGEVTLTVRAPPGAFRALDAGARALGGRLEVVSVSAQGEGDANQAAAIAAAEAQAGRERPVNPTTAQLPALCQGAGEQRPVPRPAPAPRGVVVVPRGPVADLPEEHAARRERFAELDRLQQGWTVELRAKPGANAGDVGEDGRAAPVDAIFFPPGGDEEVGSYALARQAAMRGGR